jgi:hypothetical protein
MAAILTPGEKSARLSPGNTSLRRALAVLTAALMLASSGTRAYAEEALTMINVEGRPAILAEIDYEYWSRLSATNAATVQLKDGSLGMIWMFHGFKGDCVRITMASSDFDPYLVLRVGSRFADPFTADDDSGLGDSARIQVELPANANYFVTATTANAEAEDGIYTLSFVRC